MINVIVVDDHQLVRTGTRRLLEDMPGIKVIAEAASGEEAVELTRRHQPQVILMDIQMPGIGGLEATRRCLRAHPEAKVITDRETGRSRGFGFVTLANSEDAQNAIDQLNGTQLDGRTLNVNEARERGGGGGRGGGGYGGGRGGGGGYGGGGYGGGGGGGRW